MIEEHSQTVHLFLGGLSHNWTTAVLHEYLSEFGKVLDIELPRDPQDPLIQRGYGFAVVTNVGDLSQLIGQHKIGNRKFEIKLRANEKIYISNIPKDCSKQMVLDAFERCRIPVTDAVLGNGYNELPIGTGFVRILTTGTKVREWTLSTFQRLGPITVGSTVIKIENHFGERKLALQSGAAQGFHLLNSNYVGTEATDVQTVPSLGQSSPQKPDWGQKVPAKKAVNADTKPKKQQNAHSVREVGAPAANKKQAECKEGDPTLLDFVPKKKSRKKQKKIGLGESDGEQSNANPDDFPALSMQISELRADEIFNSRPTVNVVEGTHNYWESSDDRLKTHSYENSLMLGESENQGQSLLELLHAHENSLHPNSTMLASDQLTGSILAQSSQQGDESCNKIGDSRTTQTTADSKPSKLGLKEKMELRKKKQQAMAQQNQQAPLTIESLDSTLFQSDDANKYNLSPFSEVYFPNEMGIFSIKPIPQSAPFYPEGNRLASARQNASLKGQRVANLNPNSPPMFPTPPAGETTPEIWHKNRNISSEQQSSAPVHKPKLEDHMSTDPYSVFPSATRKLLFPFYAFPGYG
jgi:RNA recognition motif. (a.k.a. RRM, RBD, or RNP domain)